MLSTEMVFTACWGCTMAQTTKCTFVYDRSLNLMTLRNQPQTAAVDRAAISTPKVPCAGQTGGSELTSRTERWHRVHLAPFVG